MKRNQLATVTFGVLTAVSLTVGENAKASPEWAKGMEVEKCVGIAKKGKNDCGANKHDCAGQSTKDKELGEWVFVPKGVCEKIAGGKVKETVKPQ